MAIILLFFAVLAVDAALTPLLQSTFLREQFGNANSTFCSNYNVSYNGCFTYQKNLLKEIPSNGIAVGGSTGGKILPITSSSSASEFLQVYRNNLSADAISIAMWLHFPANYCSPVETPIFTVGAPSNADYVASCGYSVQVCCC